MCEEMSEPLTIQCLPGEILLKIFGFVVDITTIIHIRYVCKKFRDVYDNLYCPTVKEISLGEETGVTYYNINNEKLIESIKMFSNLESFSIKSSFLLCDKVDKDLSLQNIKHNIEKFIRITSQSCTKLEIIYISDVLDFSKPFIIEICDLCQNLKGFTFELLNESDDDILVDDIIESFTTRGIQFYTIQSTKKFSLESLNKILNSPIKSLLLLDHHLEKEYIDCIIGHKNETMKILIIDCYVGMGFQITEKNMIRMAASCPNLVKLKLTSYNLNPGDVIDTHDELISMEDIEILVSNCPNLKTINFNYITYLPPGTEDYLLRILPDLNLKIKDY